MTCKRQGMCGRSARVRTTSLQRTLKTHVQRAHVHELRTTYSKTKERNNFLNAQDAVAAFRDPHNASHRPPTLRRALRKRWSNGNTIQLPHRKWYHHCAPFAIQLFQEPRALTREGRERATSAFCNWLGQFNGPVRRKPRACANRPNQRRDHRQHRRRRSRRHREGRRSGDRIVERHRELAPMAATSSRRCGRRPTTSPPS